MIKTFKEIIDRWPSKRALADDMKETLSNVRKWHVRGSIPSNRWYKLIRAAKKRKYKTVTPDLLILIDREKP